LPEAATLVLPLLPPTAGLSLRSCALPLAEAGASRSSSRAFLLALDFFFFFFLCRGEARQLQQVPRGGGERARVMRLERGRTGRGGRAVGRDARRVYCASSALELEGSAWLVLVVGSRHPRESKRRWPLAGEGGRSSLLGHGSCGLYSWRGNLKTLSYTASSV